MKPRKLAAAWLAGAVLAALAAAGCQGNGSDKWWERGGATAAGAADAGGGGQPAAQPASGWIIVLQEFRGPNRQRDAQKMKAGLEAKGWQGVGVADVGVQERISGPAGGRVRARGAPDVEWQEVRVSLVYFGPFSEGEVRKQLKAIQEMKDASGQPRFAGCYERDLPTRDPKAPPEWLLSRAQGYWTLQVAHFVDPGPAFPATDLMVMPPGWDRKQAAVDFCGELRKRGFPAYFIHGGQMSLVTVGTFPKGVFVADSTFVSGSMTTNIRGYDPVTDRYTDPKLNALREHEEVIDGKREKIFRYNLENGNKLIQVTRMANGQTRREAQPSFLIMIPNAENLAPAPPEEARATPTEIVVLCTASVIDLTTGETVASAVDQSLASTLDELGKNLAFKLVGPDKPGKLVKGLPAGEGIVVISLRNRSGKDTGLVICDDLAERLTEGLRAAGQTAVKSPLNVRDTLENNELDRPEVVKDPALKDKLKGARYVVIGAVTVG